MLFKLSLNNIKKSFKDYAIYFFILILGVAVFYVFNAIEDQTIFLNVSKYTYTIITLMNRMLEFVSVFVSVILGFLIIYASRFLIKRRNKEFGTYMILGMSKGKISKILLFETIMIGFISLVVGLILGVMLSQVMSILVANMFEADLTKFAFVISKDAIIKTIIYFAIMYLLVMIFNTISVSKCKLIDLLYSNKKSEQVKIKNPYICIIIFIIASIMLGYAYYLVTIKVTEMINLKEVVKPVLLGVIGTFLIIWSLSCLILKIVMSLKNLYFNKLNSFTLRQLSSKINTTVFSMTIVCLMLFITICTLSSSLSLKNSMTANLKELAPVDIQFMKKLDLEEFYQEENAYYQQMGTNAPFGLGGVVLITPMQTIGVYNEEALDINGLMVPGLGGHGKTVDLVLAKMFDLKLEGNDFKKNKILKTAITGKQLNYIYIVLTNSLAGKLAMVEIPAKIDEKEFNELVKLSKIFSLLGVETKALISSFDPTKKDGGDYDVNNNEISDVSLEGALNYLRTNKMVLPDINLYNVYKKENLYKYQEEEVIRTR